MTKIEALKQTIINVESGKYGYYWGSSDTCNCGVVARTLLGGEYALSNGLLDIERDTSKGVFSGSYYCSTTKIKLPKVFQVLKDAGFSYEELNGLEYLSGEDVCNKLSWGTILVGCGGRVKSDLKYDNKKNLLSYLRAWVEILEEEAKPVYLNITKSLAVLPTEERSDKKTGNPILSHS